jgi:hypothetical protein
MRGTLRPVAVHGRQGTTHLFGGDGMRISSTTATLR